MKKNIRHNTAGFTLLEVLLSLALVITLVSLTAFFLNSLLEARLKQQTISEVEQEGRRVLNVITQTIRNSTIINSPVAGSAATLSVGNVNLLADPTVFSLNGAILEVTAGVSAPVALNSPAVEISNLNFTNLTPAGSAGIIGISFTVSHRNNGRQEYIYTQDFYSSASRRY